MAAIFKRMGNFCRKSNFYGRITDAVEVVETFKITSGIFMDLVKSEKFHR